MSRYMNLDELLNQVDRGPREKLRDIYRNNIDRFNSKQGSQYNHQAWPGGYLDHVTEVMNIARMLYPVMNEHRLLTFSLSSAFIALFLHDIEKLFPEKLEAVGGEFSDRKVVKKVVRDGIINDNQLWSLLSNDIINAINYAEGEGNHYTNTQRTMSPLATFVHICDVTSARIWFDRPLAQEETWGRRHHQ